MQFIMSILCFATLLVWTQSASAQSASYSVSVSFHKGLEKLPFPVRPLSDEQVRKILSDASRMLQKPGHKDTDDNVACNVTLTLNGPVRTFDATGTRSTDKLAIASDQFAVVDEDNIEAVHAVRSPDDSHVHIKVVQKILFCRKELGGGPFAGCAFSPEAGFRSMIVIHPDLHKGPEDSEGKPTKGPDHLLWAHEFGHLTGLGHRDDEPVPSALMTKCDVAGQFFKVPDTGVKVNRAECQRLLKGPGFPAPVSLRSDVKCKCDDRATCGL